MSLHYRAEVAYLRPNYYLGLDLGSLHLRFGCFMRVLSEEFSTLFSIYA